ncbi:MAG: hypothetical protein ACTHMV_16390 [Chitinophagaceae bacterium]
MKTTNPKSSKPATKVYSHKKRPENKDDLDSREGEEQEFKGDDMTHNQKDHQHERKKVKQGK